MKARIGNRTITMPDRGGRKAAPSKTVRMRLPGALAGPSPLRRFTVYGDPLGKPRMTQRDKWLHRACVRRYHAWCAEIRFAAKCYTKIRLTQPAQLVVKAWFAAPAGQHRVGPHVQKPDASNVLKGIEDALFSNDEFIWRTEITKLWADGGTARIEVEWY